MSLSMQPFPTFFVNFFGLSTFIAGMFYLLVSLFVFLSIRQKSRATLHLGFSYLYSALLCIAYVPAYTWYDPAAALHRWLTVPAVLLTHAHYAQVFFHFPRLRYPRAARALLVFHYTLAIALTGSFYYVTWSTERVYSFGAHFWDFDADGITRIVALAIVFNMLTFTLTGIVHIIKRPGLRLPVSGILLGMLITVVAPAITNVLSRNGLLARDVHQTVFVLMAIVGLFMVLIVYLNSTEDSTTFMGKLVGVSLVTFMVVMVFLCYVSFQEREVAYDALHRERASRLAAEPDFRVAELEYLTVYELETGRFRALAGDKRRVDIEWDALRDEFEFTALYESVRALGGQNWRTELERLLADTPPHFAGYRALLLTGAAATTTTAGPGELLEALDDSSQRFRYHRKRIARLPERGYRAALHDYLERMPAHFRPFTNAVRDGLAARPELSGQALRREAGAYLTPFHRHGMRRYRRDGGSHYTAFMHYDPAARRVVEAGFSYPAYRDAIHRVGLKQLLVFVAVVLVIVIGFRLFFLGTLVRPVDALLDAVRRINSGDLDVVVRVQSADEFGFLSRSFNNMVASIRDARLELKEYADELENKVRERTAELQSTLDRVQELKDQQDGDYFLTSLLLKPLGGNRVRSDSVQVDFFVRQKKRFSFRKWNEEIGGDFCSAHSIALGDRNHTVFLNADAMGKSIQGAGGALVLGAVFESLLERTRSIPALGKHSPERWIKNAFRELQTVFETFEGSMLVSMVLGIIDDETGLLYYVNVEHPSSVLYRDGRAGFIEEQPMFRKLGIAGLPGSMSVLTVQLRPGDVLILGSDGRDDLLLGTVKPGVPIMNEDEQLFVKIVERSAADLERIYENLQREGELSDDLSLIRVSFQADRTERPEPEHEARLRGRLRQAKNMLIKGDPGAEDILRSVLEQSRRPSAMRMLMRILVESKRHAEALNLAEDYILLQPADTEIMFLAAYLCKRLRRFEDAVEYAERVRLRSPDFARNLVTLGEAHAALGNYDRAGKMLDRALELEDNERTQRLRNQLERVRS